MFERLVLGQDQMPSTLTEVRLRLQVLSRVGCKNVSSKQARTSYLQYIPQSRMQSQASGHRGARGEALPGDSVHGGRLSFLGTAGVRRESRRGCFWHQEPRMSPRKLYGFGPFGNWRSTATLACTCTNSVVLSSCARTRSQLELVRGHWDFLGCLGLYAAGKNET